jgi:hypothetical protein
MTKEGREVMKEGGKEGGAVVVGRDDGISLLTEYVVLVYPY